MEIEIWSDVVCPWCFIGKRRLEKALATFEHADAVRIRYRSYQLDPGAPVVATETVAESLGRKYGGGPSAGQRMIDQVEAVAIEEGLVFRLGQAQRANTVDAHQLLHLAATLDDTFAVQRALKERLLDAYFLRAENVADHDVLRAAAADVDLPGDRVDEVLASREFADDVQADIDQAHAFGVSGVPFFVFDRALAVPGAASVEQFRAALDQAWATSHPVLQTIAAGDGACGPDGCALP